MILHRLKYLTPKENAMFQYRVISSKENRSILTIMRLFLHTRHLVLSFDLILL